MIRCYARHCKEISDEPRVERVCDGPSEAWGVRQVTYTNIECCPACGSTNIEEVVMCERCEKEPAVHLDAYCEACGLIMDSEQARDFHQDAEAIAAEKPDDFTETILDTVNPWRKAS